MQKIVDKSSEENLKAVKNIITPKSGNSEVLKTYHNS